MLGRRRAGAALEGRAGLGGGRGQRLGGTPYTDSRDPLEEARFHRRTLKSLGEGIKRWGIEGIRIGTSDRFGQGRGE